MRNAANANLAGRDDIVRRREVFGALAFEATFVPARAPWLATATDERGRRIRGVLKLGRIPPAEFEDLHNR